MIAVVLRMIWHFKPVLWLAAVGGFFAVLGISFVLIGWIVLLGAEQEGPNRRWHLGWRSALSGLAIVICVNLFFSFGGHHPQLQKRIVFKNTSEQKLTNLKLWWGSQELALPVLGPRESRELLLVAPAEIQAKVVLKSSDGVERSSQFLVGPENKRIQLLIDWELNVLAEVQ